MKLIELAKLISEIRKVKLILKEKTEFRNVKLISKKNKFRNKQIISKKTKQ